MNAFASQRMTIRFAVATLLLAALNGLPAYAQGELSRASEASVLPLASISGVTGVLAGAVAGASTSAAGVGVVLTVTSVQTSANSTVLVLEGMSESTRVVLDVARRISVGVGTAVSVSVIAAGTIFSVGGEVIAFVPSAVGQMLLHSERLAQ